MYTSLLYRMTGTTSLKADSAVNFLDQCSVFKTFLLNIIPVVLSDELSKTGKWDEKGFVLFLIGC